MQRHGSVPHFGATLNYLETHPVQVRVGDAVDEKFKDNQTAYEHACIMANQMCYALLPQLNFLIGKAGTQHLAKTVDENAVQFRGQC